MTYIIKRFMKFSSILLLISLLFMACSTNAVSGSMIGSSQISPKDGMTLLYVPEGEFIMGTSNAQMSSVISEYSQYNPGLLNKDFFKNEQPQHKVWLNAYWIDKTEVTNSMYAKCVDAWWGCTPPKDIYLHSLIRYFGNPEYDNHPVVNITWDQAKNYCKWAGRRLPTEAEWEKAARGIDGRTYPWGEKIECQDTNIGCTDRPTKVGSYPTDVSPYGAMDMAGNVTEWVADWYSENYYQNQSTWRNPNGPSSGTQRVGRGGNWLSGFIFPRTSQRFYLNPENNAMNGGVRCALSIQ